MAATGGIQVVGLRETVRTLERMGVEAADLKAAFNKIGQLVTTEAHILVPKGKTGRLEASIKASKTKNKSIVRAGSARVPYAGVIHYGGYNNIKAQPFLATAVANKQDKIVAAMDEELSSLIRRLGLNN